MMVIIDIRDWCCFHNVIALGSVFLVAGVWSVGSCSNLESSIWMKMLTMLVLKVFLIHIETCILVISWRTLGYISPGTDCTSGNRGIVGKPHYRGLNKMMLPLAVCLGKSDRRKRIRIADVSAVCLGKSDRRIGNTSGNRGIV